MRGVAVAGLLPVAVAESLFAHVQLDSVESSESSRLAGLKTRRDPIDGLHLLHVRLQLY